LCIRWVTLEEDIVVDDAGARGRHRTLYRPFYLILRLFFPGDLTSGTRIGEQTSVNSEDNLLTTIGRLIRRNASSCYHTFYQSGGISGHSGDLLRLAT
jgi:hypothetical protein